MPRDIESEGCIINLKDNSYWITKLKLSGKTISFNVLENSEIETGHRFDTIVISYKNERIGAICVTQARKPISTKRLVWALSNAMYRNKALCNSGMSGLEVTKAIYNLSKTTNGKDSYKNYPAFAYCIEMNHDPENNMEWHLPSENEIRAYAKGQWCEGFAKKRIRKFSANRNFSNSNFREKDAKAKRVLIFFCAVCQVFFVRFTFCTPCQSACKK